MSYVSFIDVSNAKSLSKKTKFILACDVDNPLTGKNGAAYVFAPQKGASDEAVVFLDKALADFAGILKKYTGKNISEMKHGGAAGGTAAGLSAFFDTEIKSGFDIVSSAVGLERKIMQSDIVITGEGCTDKQTLHGKLPVKVSELAAKHGKRCILISGRILLDDRELDSAGFDLCYGTARAEDSEDGIIKNAELRLAETAAEIELNKFS